MVTLATHHDFVELPADEPRSDDRATSSPSASPSPAAAMDQVRGSTTTATAAHPPDLGSGPCAVGPEPLSEIVADLRSLIDYWRARCHSAEADAETHRLAAEIKGRELARQALAIPDIRPAELLSLWSELDDAYHGENGFGGDTAELYAYRLDVLSPYRLCTELRGTELHKKEEAQANVDRVARLYNLLALFESMRECEVTVNGVPLLAWACSSPLFDHRVHVRVLVLGVDDREEGVLFV